MGLQIIDRHVTIKHDGDGEVVLDAAKQSQILSIREGNVTLHGLTLRNGRTSQGGGLLVQDGQLRMEACLVHLCTATGWKSGIKAGGGGLAVLGLSRVVLQGVHFHENAAEKPGGALAVDIYPDGGRGAVTLQQCTFTQNVAPEGPLLADCWMYNHPLSA